MSACGIPSSSSSYDVAAPPGQPGNHSGSCGAREGFSACLARQSRRAAQLVIIQNRSSCSRRHASDLVKTTRLKPSGPLSSHASTGTRTVRPLGPIVACVPPRHSPRSSGISHVGIPHYAVFVPRRRSAVSFNRRGTLTWRRGGLLRDCVPPPRQLFSRPIRHGRRPRCDSRGWHEHGTPQLRAPSQPGARRNTTRVHVV